MSGNVVTRCDGLPTDTERRSLHHFVAGGYEIAMVTHVPSATRPIAPGEQIFQPAPSSDAAGLVADAHESPDRRDWLRRIEGALRDNLARGYLESEEQFRQIAEALNDIVSLTDTGSRRVLFVNEAYERIWGRSRADLYASPLAFLEGVHPDDRARVRDTIVKRPHVAYDLEFRIVRPTGDQRWVWTRGFPVRNADGEIYRTASITEDITERKRVVESHERLIRGFTHDVKNPLGAADGYLSLLEDGVLGGMSAAQTESVGHARRCIRTALNLVSQLLEIERAEAGQLTVERKRMDLGAVTRQLVEEFRAAASANRLTLEVDVPRGDDAFVHSDPARVRQILANLLSNGVKYTQPDGHIAVRAYVAVDEGPTRHGRWLAVAVTDNGPGIPFAQQNLIFREFTRFDPNAAEGTGIGLAISQRLAHALGGAITCKSTPGAGSTFTLWLPCDPRPTVGE